jgi:hypothetical protein
MLVQEGECSISGSGGHFGFGVVLSLYLGAFRNMPHANVTTIWLTLAICGVALIGAAAMLN